MATESGILMASVFLPLLMSPIAYFLAKRKGIGLVTWFTFGTLGISTILVILPAITITNANPFY